MEKGEFDRFAYQFETLSDDFRFDRCVLSHQHREESLDLGGFASKTSFLKKNMSGRIGIRKD